MPPADRHLALHDQARRDAVGIVRTLRDAGFVAYLAGGCVRDELLGLTPTDYDVATDAEPGSISPLFERTSEVGVAFGVVLVHHGRNRVTEVATFRREFGYADKRRPDRVEFTTAEQDARRRDFTVNALFLDPLDDRGEPIPGDGGRVIDFVGGLADLDGRLIRAVGDPEARLAEDHLRALRAVRFACRLGFSLDGRTAGAIRVHASELEGVSRERIGDECRKMLGHPSRAEAAGLLQSLGLDAPVLAEPHAEPGLPVLARLPGVAGPALALGAWAIDRHGEAAGEACRGWRRALCLSNDERDALEHMLETLGVLRTDWLALPVARQKRVAAAPSFADARTLLRAIDPAADRAVARRVEELAGIGMGLWPAPLLDGEALIAMGMTPGPGFTRILYGVFDAQLDGRVSDRAAAERLARELAVEHGV